MQPHVPGVASVTPTTMDAGLKMIWDTITKHSNLIMQRAILMTEMSPSDYDDWRTWGLTQKEQSQRCAWGAKYTWGVAALDALLYQCPDQTWKKKILVEKWDFQQALDYGIREVTAKKMDAELGKKNGQSDKSEDIPANRVEEELLL